MERKVENDEEKRSITSGEELSREIISRGEEKELKQEKPTSSGMTAAAAAGDVEDSVAASETQGDESLGCIEEKKEPTKEDDKTEEQSMKSRIFSSFTFRGKRKNPSVPPIDLSGLGGESKSSLEPAAEKKDDRTSSFVTSHEEEKTTHMSS